MIETSQSTESYFRTVLGTAEKARISSQRSANRAMTQFITVRLGLVIFGALLPFLTTLNNTTWAAAAGVIVAILVGLDTQFQWGEEWREYRSTELSLERFVREYESRQMMMDKAPVDGIDSQLKNVQKLSSDVEELLRQHTNRFFKFRITPSGKGR